MLHETVDLDALMPECVRVRLGGREYKLLPAAGQPLAAAFAAQKFEASEKGPDDVVALLAVVVPEMDEETVRRLGTMQLKAIMRAIFPPPAAEANDDVDPPRSAHDGAPRSTSSSCADAQSSCGSTGTDGSK